MPNVTDISHLFLSLMEKTWEVLVKFLPSFLRTTISLLFQVAAHSKTTFWSH